MKTETIGALYRNTDISEKELLLDILNNFGDSFNKENQRIFTARFISSSFAKEPMKNLPSG
jgi:hypothetical protein